MPKNINDEKEEFNLNNLKIYLKTSETKSKENKGIKESNENKESI